jgi:hypothetical protein
MDETAGVVTRPVTRKRRLLVVCLAVIAITATTAIGVFLGARLQDRHWKPLYERAATAEAHWKSKSRHSSALAESWRRSNDRNQTELLDLRSQISSAVGDLNHPRFVTWNTPARLYPGRFLIGSVPDTFTFEAELRSTAPITLMIMTVKDFACWYTKVCASHWVEWGPSRYVNGIFHAAEGCASYVAIITGSGRVVPEVSAIHKPARHATGACR